MARIFTGLARFIDCFNKAIVCLHSPLRQFKYALALLQRMISLRAIPKFRNGSGKILANASTSLLGLLRANAGFFRYLGYNFGICS
jgi:hypothetical protein